jgi:bis(5'-nucleosidyl)-tetraphosphatase
MKYEKSCGAVVYRTADNKFEFLSIKSRKFGHWGFPKGHVENHESEQETAIREIYEETGLQVVIQSEFKQAVEYPLSSNAHKEVIYFIAESSGQPIIIQQEEVQDYKWLDFNGTYQLLSYKNDKDVLEAVNAYLTNWL